MAVFLVRHAKAGSRSDWPADDVLRPLSKSGRRQADALARRLAPLTHGPLISSPFVRCVQTLEPLADAGHRIVQTDERLAEEASFGGALELIAGAVDGTVLCSHGDVIPATLAALERRGATIVSDPDWRKATVWVLERDQSGAVTSATCWPPPALD